MPYVNNDGIRIHYEVEGNGTPLVLQHGITNSLEFWRLFGYVEKLKNKYRLLLIDARGHGLSDKPHDPKLYSWQMRASDVVAVLDDLNIPRAHYWGYSMGGRIGFAAMKYFPQRFFSFIIGGVAPYKQDPARIEEMLQLLRNGISALVAQSEKSSSMLPEEKAIRLANDPDALIAMLESGKGVQGFEHILPMLTLPCLIYTGDADPLYEGVKRGASQIPNAIFVSYPNLNHMQAYRASDLVLPHVEKFLAAQN